MKNPLLLLMGLLTACVTLQAQTLPNEVFTAIRDSTTAIDMINLTGDGGSISIDNQNVDIFRYLLSADTDKKPANGPSVMIMWLRNGREIASGNIHWLNEAATVVVKIAGKEHVHKVSPQGYSILKSIFKP